MTFEETREILSILRINYPQSFRGWDKDQGTAFLGLWAEAFKEEPAQLVVSAVKAIIYTDTREFAPNIGQVKSKMFDLTHPDEMTPQEAWSLIRKSCSIYHAADKIKALPDVLRRMVTVQELTAWAKMDEHELDTVIASNWQRSYKVRLASIKQVEMLPEPLKKAIQGGMTSLLDYDEESC